MVRVILDTSVLLAGLFFDGFERRLLELILEGRIQLVLPEHVIWEVHNVVTRKSRKFGNESIAMDLLDGLLNLAEYVPASKYRAGIAHARTLIRDSSDAPILAGVLSTKHDFFVTNDKDFHTLNLPTRISAYELTKLIKHR